MTRNGRFNIENKKRIMRTVFCLGMILAAPVMGGCGDKQVEYVTENITGENETPDSSVSDEQGASIGITSSVSYVLDGNGERPSYKIDASVSAMGMENVGVYDVQFDVVDDAYLKAFAEDVFDDGEYYIVKPYHASSLDELLAEEERLREIGKSLGTMTDSDEIQYPVPVQNRLDALEQEMNAGVNDNADYAKFYGEDCILQKYDSRLSNDYLGSLLCDGIPDTSGRGTNSITHMAGTMRGSIDGAVCEMNVWTASYPAEAGSRGLEESQAHTEYSAVYNLTFLDNPVSIYQECTLDDESEEQYGQNICDIEKSEQEAETMLAKLGFADYMKVEASHLVTEKDDDLSLDGYCFTYVYAPDGVAINYLHTMYADYKFEGIDEADSWVSVYVNSGGIAYVSVSCPMKATEKKEAGNLKPFSEIDALAQSTLTTGNLYDEPDMTCRIYAVKLVYGIVTEDEESHALRPMWVYCAVDDSESNIGHKCVVVAIDAVSGNIIYCADATGASTEYFLNW